MRARRGLCITELLFAIAAMAVLLGVTSAGIRGSRQVSQKLRCELNCRACHNSVYAYAAEHRDSFPCIGTPRGGPPANSALTVGGLTNGGAHVSYFAQEVLWLKALKGYLDHDRLASTATCPGSPVFTEIIRPGLREEFLAQYGSDYVQPASYWLSGTTLADPAYFEEGAAPRRASLLRAMRTHDVVYSDRKGIFIEPRAYHVRPRAIGARDDDGIVLFGDRAGATAYVSAFADGHIGSYLRTQLIDGVELNPGDDPTPVLRTRQGVRGLDR